jgi:hypothetical protein
LEVAARGHSREKCYAVAANLFGAAKPEFPSPIRRKSDSLARLRLRGTLVFTIALKNTNCTRFELTLGLAVHVGPPKKRASRIHFGSRCVPSLFRPFVDCFFGFPPI